VVVSKSPLSNCIANPCCGGYFGPNLKYAGYDFLILEGKADVPSYLYIRDDQVEIRDAAVICGANGPPIRKRPFARKLGNGRWAG
jgi:aldehyde:ferredoxin oxidoreductase